MKYTREQLEKMCDKDINILLTAKILGEPWESYSDITENGGYLHLSDALGNPYLESIKDYCNNWNDIMPLAVEHSVSLCPSQDKPETEWYADAIFSNDIESCWCDKSPQRAIACCLLMMEIDK